MNLNLPCTLFPLQEATNNREETIDEQSPTDHREGNSQISQVSIVQEDSEHLHFHLNKNRTPIILRTGPVPNHLR